MAVALYSFSSAFLTEGRRWFSANSDLESLNGFPCSAGYGSECQCIIQSDGGAIGADTGCDPRDSGCHSGGAALRLRADRTPQRGPVGAPEGRVAGREGPTGSGRPGSLVGVPESSSGGHSLDSRARCGRAAQDDGSGRRLYNQGRSSTSEFLRHARSIKTPANSLRPDDSPCTRK
jgi:hypothetical protein